MNQWYYSLMMDGLLQKEEFIGYSKDFLSKIELSESYIWGGGQDGLRAYGFCKILGITVRGFIDKNKAGGDINGVPVYDMTLVDGLYNETILVATRNYENEIDLYIRNKCVGKCIGVYSYFELSALMVRGYLFGKNTLDTYEWQQMDGKLRIYLFGEYESFEEANIRVESMGEGIIGYEHEAIFKRIVNDFEKNRQGIGRSGFEAFWTLLHVCAKDKHLEVLDFGGSLGQLFFRNGRYLSGDDISWNIVEQKDFVEYGRKKVKEINFYHSVEECISDKQINVFFFSSVLQYLKNFQEVLIKTIQSNPQYIVIDRTPVIQGESVCVNQSVPESHGYSAIYPMWLLNEKELKDLFINSGYGIFYEGMDYEDTNYIEWRGGRECVKYKRYIMEKR